ncbi:hypothetical protein [Natronococcus jeotgali]|uniref:Uncharacterized protein n=1 Tax=Natronococcus jeotgali DSM 18795 TaxID=1227498 RepID=L9XK02_9EURY|nr:hypothetical protein [Natronococcus jeotgali]ELY62040.1 hypothetical protein C492_08555 [Natronococcus jeotgali DSM 18795]
MVIARSEWVLYQREYRGIAGRRLLWGAVIVISVVLGWGMYELGRDVATGETAPFSVLGITAISAMAWVAWRSSRLSRNSFEELEPDFLLATVPASVPALGLLLFVYARIAIIVAAPTIAIAIGAAVGLRAPTVALTVVLAVATSTAVAVGAGVSARLAAHLIGMRLARGRTYRDLLILFGWLPLLVGWFLLGELPNLSLTRLDILPAVAVVDLALLGAFGQAGINPARGLATFIVIIPAAALLAGTTTALARRIWEGEPTARTAPSGSHSLLEAGWVERLTGERLPRPVRTIARKRWVSERRSPRGLLYTGYVLFFVGVVLFPVLGIIGVPGFVLVIHAIGLSVGLAFGSDPIGIEYRGLTMVLTTVRGRAFVGGLLLAALAPAVVIVPAVVFPLGVISAATPGEIFSFILFGIAVCGCTASLALAAGLDVDRSEFSPVSGFFTDVPWYAETGWGQFQRIGAILVGATLAVFPAFIGTHPAVYERLAAAGVPPAATRSGALLLGALAAAGATQIVFGIAVDRYKRYSIE